MAALTFAQATSGAVNALSQNQIDELTKENYFIGAIPVDNTATPTGFGHVYQYERVSTAASATTRAINAEYTENQALITPYTVNLKMLGGTFKIDRALINSAGTASKLAFQFEQKRKAIGAAFADLLFNGDEGGDATQFDGLETALAASSTEIDGASLDLSTLANMTTNYKAFFYLVDQMLAEMDGTPTFIAMNKTMLSKFKFMGKLAGALQPVESFGKQMLAYDGIPLIHAGTKSGSTTEIVATAATLTGIYAVRFGLDGVHAVTPSDPNLVVQTFMPDLKAPGAVKTGEMELITSLAIKATKSAAKIKALKVAAA